MPTQFQNYTYNRESYFLLKVIVVLCLNFIGIALFAQSKGRVLYDKDVETGAEQMQVYLPLLEGKNVAVVANQTSVIENVHLVDTLLSRGVNIVKVFAPEHGFRGKADAGAHVVDGIDSKTGLPLVSLYGSNKKPKASDLNGVDIVVFDIQDVGVRFYTYISTLHYVMEACAENVKECLVLDRPNPNGFYVDGPVLDKKFKSFVGMDPIPVVHGMTVAEYAQMINEEGWLKNGVRCALEVVKCVNYNHKDFYQLPIKPSPNLPDMTSIYLYPSLCFFEGTIISVGRGTDTPFQIYGHPKFAPTGFSFIPESREGATNPKLKGEVCHGYNLIKDTALIKTGYGLNYNYIINAYNLYPSKKDFFLANDFINLLAGTDLLKEQIIKGMNQQQMSSYWRGDVEKFKLIRSKYLLYDDF